MHIIVSMEADGLIVATTTQGQILAECFFKAEDETVDELRQMGYTRLLHTYAAATVEAGPGLEHTDLEDVFLDGDLPMEPVRGASLALDPGLAGGKLTRAGGEGAEPDQDGQRRQATGADGQPDGRR